MRRVFPLAIAMLVSAVATSSASARSSVPVVRCPTVFGVPSEARQPPRSIAVLGSPASTRGLVAYTNTFDYLIGPPGMRCWGIVAVDGGQQVVVWAPGHGKPALHARYAGLTLSIDPACAGCKAADACPFFPQLASNVGFPCPTGIPPGEHVYGLRATITLFEDPPGVTGDGWPSGGPYRADGLVGLNTEIPRFPG